MKTMDKRENTNYAASPAVSVIVPVYKAEKYLHKCVDSLLAQTFTDFEVLLVDDGSPDRSGEICDGYAARDSRVRVFHKENGGVSSARQCGIDNARGEYTIHADPDDWVEPNMLEALYSKAREESADIVICDFSKVYSEKRDYIKVSPPTDKEQCICYILLGRMHASLCNKLIRLSLYKDNNITFIQGINLMEDLSVLFRLLYFSNKIVYVPQSLYLYNKQNEQSYTSTPFNDGYYEGYLKLKVLFCSFFSKYPVGASVKWAVRFKLQELLSSMLLYSSDTFLKKKQSEFPSFDLAALLKHPTLTLHYRSICLLYGLHQMWAIRLIRLAFRKLKK